MKLKTIKGFYDLQAGKGRKIGDEFEADGHRAAQLIEKGFVSAADAKAEEGKGAASAKVQDPQGDAKPKRTRKKT